jgi:uncharacterized repeat protein (TIGR02543 family)
LTIVALNFVVYGKSKGESHMKIRTKTAFRRSLALLTSAFMLLGLNAGIAFAEGYSDTAGHWGAPVIEKWSEYDVLHGNGDGTFAPNRDMSVAEFATVLVNAFGYTAAGSPSVSPSVPAWAADNVRKAVTAGVIASDETGLTLTRELAAKILAKALDAAPAAGTTAFADDDAISAAYKPYVKALGARGVFVGDAGGNFMPQKGFTRAEVMQVLENTVTDIVRADKPAASEKSLIVNAPGVALTAGTVKGDLIVGQGVGDGDVTLTDVKVEGRLVVYGGGGNSVNIRGASVIPNVVVNKTFGESARLAIEGAATVGTVTVVAGSGAAVAGSVAKLEVVPATEVAPSGEIANAAIAAATDVAVVSGTVAELDISAENVSVAIAGGVTVTNLVVAGDGAEITVSSGATVTAATVSASDVAIEGSGKVTNVTVTEASAGGVEVTVPGAKINNESGAAVSVGAGKTVDAGKTNSVPAASGGGGGGGGNGDNDVIYYTVTFDYNGGTGPTANTVQVASGGTVQAGQFPVPTRTGYVFAGWATAEGVVFDASASVTGTLTVYAAWAKLPGTPTVTFAYSGSNATTTFAYDAAVTGPAVVLAKNGVSQNATVTVALSSDKKTLTATADMTSLTPGEDYTLSVTAKAETDVTQESAPSTYAFKAVSGEFTRANAGTHTVAYAGKDNVVGLKTSGGDSWYYTSDALFYIFDAVYAPNKNVTDGAGNNALGLFHITIGTDANGKNDIIELKGSGIPNSGLASAPLEIHVGVPDPDKDNSNLPEFRIPQSDTIGIGALGIPNGDYGGSRIVVNKGAYLNIYVPAPAAPSAPTIADLMSSYLWGNYTGGFANGNITVMPGGILRDGSLTDWPLGGGSSISAYCGSNVLIGPGDKNGNTDEFQWITDLLNQQGFDYGFFVAPSGKDSIAVWTDGPDISNGYIDIMPGEVNMNANLTVKKGIGLTYAIWIRSGRTLTIDLVDSADELGGKPIYGVDTSTASTDQGGTASKIVVKNGTLTAAGRGLPGDADVSASGGSVTLRAQAIGTYTESGFTAGAGKIGGYASWTIATPPAQSGGGSGNGSGSI